MSALAKRSPVVADVLLPALLDAIGEGILLLDHAHVIEFVNQAAQDLSGQPADKLIGQPLKELIPDADLSLWLKNAKRGSTQEPRASHPPQGTLRRPDGSSVPVELTVAEVTSQRTQHVVVVLRDLTERHRLAHDLARMRKLSVIGTFTGGLAQELSDLLTAIAVATEALAEGLLDPVPPEAKAALDQLRAVASRGGGIAGQLLALGIPGQLELRPVDLVGVLQDAAPALQRLLPGSIALNWRAEPGPLLVLAAPGAVEEILLELVTNARDAMPRGGLVTIDLRFVLIETVSPARSAGPPPGDYVCLSVDDTGVGMDGEVRAKVFTPFFSTKPAGPGTGLGTATVQGLVRQHGGYVTLHSAARHGTTMRVYLPVLEQAARSMLSQEPSRPAGTTTILVVDDEEPLLRIAQRALEHCGYRVITARRGAEALAFLRGRGGEIDVVVSDITMPGLSGRQLHEAARRDGIEVPFIFTSGYAPGEASGTADVEQDPAFLRKPWTIDDLVRRVREALEGGP